MTGSPGSPRPNRLVHCSSPYLRQHAFNPVDWYPWGAAALERARREDRPILLSVGYSACHWCHVMAHESFEDPEMARLMNEHFVCIKVDREERPDIDQVYQVVCQILTGRGGWPLTVFLTPDLLPYYAGTYFPPRPRLGLPGLAEVLEACARAYREQRERVRQQAGRLADAVRQALEAPGTGRQRSLRDQQVAPDPSRRILARAAEQLLARRDPEAGGFGRAPKFPHPTGLELLLRAAWHWGYGPARSHLLLTLERMAWGGMFDHVGGGFHRYAVDRWWQVPHFEKMLYDQALLVPLYVRVGLWEGRAELLEVARRTLDFMVEEMRLEEGGLAASLNADSPDASGRLAEGHFYRWSPEEVQAAVGDRELAAAVCRWFGIGREPEGVVEERLLQDGPPGWLEEARTVLGRFEPLGSQEREAVAGALARMKEYREGHRTRPARDDKVVLAWHALALSALAAGYQTGLGDEPRRYLQDAEAGWAFVERHLQHPSAGLLHTPGPDALPAFADDYACLVHAALDLHRCTLNRAYLEQAARLADEAEARFGSEQGLYYLSSDRHGSPLTRSLDLWDQITPSPTAAMAAAQARLGALLDDASRLELAWKAVQAAWPLMLADVSGTAGLWCALDRLEDGTATVTIRAEALREELVSQLLRLPHPGLELRWEPAPDGPTYGLCLGTTCLAPQQELEPILAHLAPAARADEHG